MFLRGKSARGPRLGDGPSSQEVTIAKPRRSSKLRVGDVASVSSIGDGDVDEVESLLLNARGHSKILQALSDDDVAVLAGEVSILEYVEGEQVMNEGDEASWVGIVLSGALEALQGSKMLGVISSGAVVGEISFFAGGRRMATVRGMMPGYIAFIAVKNIRDILAKSPETGASWIRMLGSSSLSQLARNPAQHPPPTANLPSNVHEVEAREVLSRCLLHDSASSPGATAGEGGANDATLTGLLQVLQYRRFKQGDFLLDRFACTSTHDGLIGFLLEGKVELECCGLLLGERGAGEVLMALDFFDASVLPYDVVGGEGGGVLAWLKRSELLALAEEVPDIFLSVMRWAGRTAIHAVKNGVLRRRPRPQGGAATATAGDLCEAAANGDLARLRALAREPDIDVGAGDYDRRTALHLAASEGMLDVVRCLVEELGAASSPVDRWGGTPLDDAVRSKHEHVVAYLRSKNATQGLTSKMAGDGDIIEAAARGDLEALRKLVQAGAKPDEGDYDQRTAMHLAASEGKLDVVQCLVEELGADPSPVDRWGGTPLDDAIRSKHQRVATWLQGRGAMLGLTSKTAGEGDLIDAAARGDLATLRKLVLAGTKPGEGDYDQRTALHLAASEGRLAVVQCLVEELGADASPVDRWGGTPLDDAIRMSHAAVVNWLRERGATTGATAKVAGDADVCSAAAGGDAEALRALVAVGAKPDVGDYDQRTPLHLAASEGMLEAVRCLVEELGVHHSPCDRWGFTPLDDATRHGHEKVIKYLVARDALLGANTVASGQPGGASVANGDLCECAFRGDVASLRTIANSGGDVNKGDYDRRTPLHVAASEGKLDVVRCLIEEFKAKLSPVDRWGNSPLDDAIRSKHAEVAMFLKARGGALNQKQQKKEALSAQQQLAWSKKLSGEKAAAAEIRKEAAAAEKKAQKAEQLAITTELAHQKLLDEKEKWQKLHSQADLELKSERRKSRNLRLELGKAREDEERYKQLAVKLKEEADRAKDELAQTKVQMDGTAIADVISLKSALEAELQQQLSVNESLRKQLGASGDPQEMAELHRAVRSAQSETSRAQQSLSVAEQQRDYARKALSVAQELSREASVAQRRAERELQTANDNAKLREAQLNRDQAQQLCEYAETIRRQALGNKCLAGYCFILIRRRRKALAEEVARSEVLRREAAKNRWVKVAVKVQKMRNAALVCKLDSTAADCDALKQELATAQRAHSSEIEAKNEQIVCLPGLKASLSSERSSHEEQRALVELLNGQLANAHLRTAQAQQRAVEERQRAAATASELKRERGRTVEAVHRVLMLERALAECETRFGDLFKRVPSAPSGLVGKSVPPAHMPPMMPPSPHLRRGEDAKPTPSRSSSTPASPVRSKTPATLVPLTKPLVADLADEGMIRAALEGGRRDKQLRIAARCGDVRLTTVG